MSFALVQPVPVPHRMYANVKTRKIKPVASAATALENSVQKLVESSMAVKLDSFMERMRAKFLPQKLSGPSATISKVPSDKAASVHDKASFDHPVDITWEDVIPSVSFKPIPLDYKDEDEDDELPCGQKENLDNELTDVDNRAVLDEVSGGESKPLLFRVYVMLKLLI